MYWVYLSEYLHIWIFALIIFLITCVILSLSYLLVFQQANIEKTSAYECGFQPFQDARTKFDIKFYLVAILFIIFDLEVVYLFPWVVALGISNWFGFWVMFWFLALLTIGFVYEWRKGALTWN